MEHGENVCSICSELVEIFAFGACDHSVCFQCSTRLRVLWEQTDCPICRTDLPQVIFSKKLMKFSDVDTTRFIKNRKSKILFESEAVHTCHLKLLEHRCPVCKVGQTERNFAGVRHHMKREHVLFYCDICVDNLKLFTNERKYYSRKDLATHRRQGDTDDSSYKGHPLCEFCDIRYLDNDELGRHLRKEHYYCHFCDVDGSNQYYSDYDVLKEHFRSDHYLCEEEECSRAQFTHAFNSDIDLKAHNATDHMRSMSKAQSRQARTIEVDFPLPPRGRQRGRGNGPDSNENRGRGTGRFAPGGRDHNKKDYYRDSRELKDMNAAVEASLRDIEKNPSQSKQKDDVSTETAEVVPQRDDTNFPTLGSPAPACIPVDLDRSNTAKHLALSNNKSVQHGTLSQDDFPTLNSENDNVQYQKSNAYAEKSAAKKEPMKKIVKKSPGNWAKKSATLEKSDFPTLGSTGKRNPVVGTRPMQITKVLQASDFPALACKSEARPSSPGLWISNSKRPSSGRSSPIAKLAVSSNVLTKSSSNPTLSNLNQSLKKDEEDFPCLGLKLEPSDNKTWVIGKVPISHSVKSKKEEEPFVEVTGKNKKSKAQKKKSKTPINKERFDCQQDPEDEKDTDTLENEPDKLSPYLTNSCSSDNSEVSQPIVADNTVKERDSPRMDTGKPLLDKSVKELNLDDFPCLSSDLESIKKSRPPGFGVTPVSSTKVTIDNRKISRPGDFPRFSSVTDIFSSLPGYFSDPLQSRENSEKNSKKLSLEEFPTLSSLSETIAPAALSSFPEKLDTSSFPEKLNTPPPPGFKNPSLSRSPPGFQTFETDKVNRDDVKETELKKTTTSEQFVYSPPENFTKRNLKLISDIRSALDDQHESFDKFKSWSGSLRQGVLAAGTYYMHCQKLFGDKNFTNLFPELLVLLPDIDKQQELLAVDNSYQSKRGETKDRKEKRTKATWNLPSNNFVSCTKCGQVLSPPDSANHMSMHNTDVEYPSLASHSGQGLRPWVKAK